MPKSVAGISKELLNFHAQNILPDNLLGMLMNMELTMRIQPFLPAMKGLCIIRFDNQEDTKQAYGIISKSFRATIKPTKIIVLRPLDTIIPT